MSAHPALWALVLASIAAVFALSRWEPTPLRHVGTKEGFDGGVFPKAISMPPAVAQHLSASHRAYLEAFGIGATRIGLVLVAEASGASDAGNITAATLVVPVSLLRPPQPPSRAINFTAAPIAIEGNETFVPLPFAVLPCAVVYGNREGLGGAPPSTPPRPENATVWVRVTHAAAIDPRAFVVVPQAVLEDACGPMSTMWYPQPMLLHEAGKSLPAQYPDNIECSGVDVATHRETLPGSPLPRMAVHIVLYWKNLGVFQKKAPYLRKILSNAQGFPMHVDVYLHVNRFPGQQPLVANESLDPQDVAELLVARSGGQDRSGPEQDGGENAHTGGADEEQQGGAVNASLRAIGRSSARSDGVMSLRSLTRYVTNRVVGHHNQRVSKKVRLVVVPHTLHEAAYFFPWKARQLIKHQRLLYDLVLSTEDDMDVKPSNLEYYCRYKNAARNMGYYLAFFRVEFGRPRKNKGSGKILSDVLRMQRISRNTRPIQVLNTTFARVEIQTYHAFWLADRIDMAALVAHAEFIRTELRFQALILEDASCLKGPMMLPHYSKGKIVPVDTHTMMIDPMSETWHMSNAYAYKGMARFEVAASIRFA